LSNWWFLGDAALKTPGTDAGTITLGRLNVQLALAQEFVNMIVAERGFQAIPNRSKPRFMLEQ
jgi:flagellar hook protein FlgE